MRFGTILTFVTLCSAMFFAFPTGDLLALDVDEEVEDVKDKAKDVVDKGKEKAKDLKEKVSDDDFLDNIPAYILHPAVLLIGVLIGFIVGRMSKGDKGNK
ncbi:MAG: hypothetical protein ACYTFG_14115, partial [Planctomycetota bacterium]